VKGKKSLVASLSTEKKREKWPSQNTRGTQQKVGLWKVPRGKNASGEGVNQSDRAGKKKKDGGALTTFQARKKKRKENEKMFPTSHQKREGKDQKDINQRRG